MTGITGPVSAAAFALFLMISAFDVGTMAGFLSLMGLLSGSRKACAEGGVSGKRAGILGSGESSYSVYLRCRGVVDMV